MRLAVLTPSRSRPERLGEMIDSIRDTMAGWVDIYVGLDDDDEHNYPRRGDVAYVVRPRMRLGAWTNVLAEVAIAEGQVILGSLGDDHRPRTQGWDDRIRLASRVQGSGLVYTRDGLQDKRLPTAPFWTVDVIKALGWFFPPVLTHMYADNYWLHLACQIDRCSYLKDVLVEHMHPCIGKGQADEVNGENDSFYEQDRLAFDRFVAGPGHAAALKRVQAMIAGL